MNQEIPANQLLVALFSLDSGWIFVKWAYVLLFGIYLLFSLVVLTQIKQMTRSLNGALDGWIMLVGLVHVALAVGALIMAIVVL
jgi:hypothetical protein